MSEFRSKTVLITGASGALGTKLCERFQSKGAEVIGLTRESLDLSDSVSVEAYAQMLRDKPIDIFIHTAAIHGTLGEFWSYPVDDFKQVMQVNLYSALSLIHAILPRMIRQQSGRIINFSGGGGTSSRPYFSAYATSKTALIRFSECLADELKNQGVTVNCIAPGVMPSKLYDESVRSGLEKSRPVPDSKSIDRASDLCLLLTSSASQTITGKIISAQWDDWTDLDHSDGYTLRRMLPQDRGYAWE